jgi:hypothetical protein
MQGEFFWEFVIDDKSGTIREGQADGIEKMQER